MEDKKFKILSIDGGGIRGIFPAMLLASIEADLKNKGIEKWQIYHHFDLICGTSTGGIIAIALALGIPAMDIYSMYLNNAKVIFGKKRKFIKRIYNSAHKRAALEKLIRETFQTAMPDNSDPRIADCKTNIAIPIYDLMEGRPSVLKSKYHPAFKRDFHIPAYQAALATSAAPTFFDPYSAKYIDLNGIERPFNNKIDGGVFANNPTLNSIIEAQKAFNLTLKDLAVFSIGTGYQTFCDAGMNKGKVRTKYGLHYWMLQGDRKRLIELFLQGQSQQVQNLISLMKNGIDRQEPDNFQYLRVDTKLDDTCCIELDETNKHKLEKLAEKAAIEYQVNGTAIVNNFFSEHK